eukprot:CAMPEP_0197944630 /NCGR_PEP_ID=MMETSP1439-20131203/125506_1 /TAXON_ID=66791 /ORGANISM="Gonyaulax spinifera, Strain CCMP409" /LENGTH=373 /DNA_ID=CAMNT_0043567883 /DNA_START=64 /DNA_END=1185 /DNA_ORIENTATION=+
MPAAQSRSVALATDCSGMETPVMALRNLGVEINHVFSCDVNKHAKTTIMANFPPKVFYDDLTTRDNDAAPKADLYVAGFPCQPFSMAGKQQGFKDARGRGEIFFHVRDYIEKKAPRIFVLENVSGLVQINGGQYYKAIIQALEALGTYNVYSKILNTKDHGVPQNRRRVYFVGIKKTCDDGSFEFPEPVPRPSLELFLEPRKRPSPGSELPPKSQTTARANVQRALKEITAQGLDPLKEHFVVDCDSSGPRMKYVRDVTPCLTCSRGRGHWVTSRQRRMTKAEMMRMQGMHPESFKVAVSDTQLGKQIGNAMSVNVLERLFARALPASGMVRDGVLVDRWENGVPPAELVASGSRKRVAAASKEGAAKKRVRV